MPYTHTLNPIIVSLGPVALSWYNLVYILGFILGWFVLKKYSKLSSKEAEDFIGWLILGTIIGARVIYVFVYNPMYYLSNPFEILAVWKGGLSFHGGIIGAAIAGFWWCRRKQKSLLALADLLVLPLSLMLVFGRLANFVNGELIGRVSESSFCVNYDEYEGCRHPYQFYAAAKNLITFIVLLPLYVKKKNEWREGTFLWLFVILYGAGRFVTDFWRAPDPTDPMFLGILLGQWLSLLMVVVGGWMLTRRQ